MFSSCQTVCNENPFKNRLDGCGCKLRKKTSNKPGPNTKKFSHEKFNSECQRHPSKKGRNNAKSRAQFIGAEFRYRYYHWPIYNSLLPRTICQCLQLAFLLLASRCAASYFKPRHVWLWSDSKFQVFS